MRPRTHWVLVAAIGIPSAQVRANAPHMVGARAKINAMILGTTATLTSRRTHGVLVAAPLFTSAQVRAHVLHLPGARVTLDAILCSSSDQSPKHYPILDIFIQLHVNYLL